jgi:Na+/melibiose symporter-like transporter
MSVTRYLLFFCGQVGMMSLARFFFQWITKFTTGSEGNPELLSAFAVGIILLGFRIFDGITDPIAGNLSDAWARAGRARQQLLWVSLLLPGTGLVITFLPNEAMPATMRWFCVAIGMFIFFVGYTFYAIPYWSLVGDYSNGDPHRRRVLSNLLGGGMVVATGIGFVVSGSVIKAYGYVPAAAIFAIAGAVLMAMPYFAAPTDCKPKKSPAGREPAMPFWASVKLALKHRRFLALIALFAGSQMSFTIMTAASPFIAENLLGGDKSDIARIMGPLLLTAVPFFFLVPAVSRRMGWLKGMLYASLGLAVIYSLSGFIGYTVIGDPFTTASLLFALGGPMVALLLGLEGEGIVDCAEERGGEARIGIYWGVFNFAVKTLNGVALLAAMILASMTKGDAWGNAAIRAMSFTAGACLLGGMLCYFLITPPRDKNETSEEE